MKDTPLSFQTPTSNRLSTQTTYSRCRRRVGICPLPLKQTCSVLWFCHLGSVPSWSSSVGLALLLPVLSSNWPKYPYGRPWILGIFPQWPRMHIYSGLTSCCTSVGCRKSLGGRPNDRLLVNFSPACRLHKLEHFSQSGVRTSCSLISSTSHQHFLVWMASPCSRTVPRW